MSKPFSGKDVVRVLVRFYGFTVVSQKGGHVKLKKKTRNGIRVTIVSLQSELAQGTLRGVLRLAAIAYDDFFSKN